MITTKLITAKGTITQTGTAGFTVTATRTGDAVNTRIEYSDIPVDEMREMIAVLLTMLDELRGEEFIASCFARYCEVTGKKFFQEGDHMLVMIHGRPKGK